MIVIKLDSVRKYDVPGYDRRSGGNLSESHHAVTIKKKLNHLDKEKRHEQVS